jgi:hypothetical protein
MVELGEPVEEFLSDYGFGIKLYSPHLDERREVGYFFGIGLHLASVGRLPPRPPNQARRALLWGAVALMAVALGAYLMG